MRKSSGRRGKSHPLQEKTSWKEERPTTEMQQRCNSSAVRQLSIRCHPLGNPSDGWKHAQLSRVCTRKDLLKMLSGFFLWRRNPLKMFSYLEWPRCMLKFTFTSNPLTLVLRGDSKGEQRGVQGDWWRKVWKRFCDLSCRQDRWNFAALADTLYPICHRGHKSHLSNPSYMAPGVASPRSKHNL